MKVIQDLLHEDTIMQLAKLRIFFTQNLQT